MMLTTPFGPYLMAPGSSFLPPGTSAKWRILCTNSSLVGYWDFDADIAQGMFDDTNCAGTDNANSLVGIDRGSVPLTAGTCGFEEANGTGISTAVSNTNLFSRSPRLNGSAFYQGSVLTANNVAFVMHFTSPVQINSIMLRDVYTNRQPTAGSLQYWDGASWVIKATLTKGSALDTTMYWRSIAMGGNVASTSS